MTYLDYLKLDKCEPCKKGKRCKGHKKTPYFVQYANGRTRHFCCAACIILSFEGRDRTEVFKAMIKSSSHGTTGLDNMART